MARSGKAKARMRKSETMAKTRSGAGRQLPRQFTMQQAARNTEERKAWSPGSQLRHKAIYFVRSGNLQPDESKAQADMKSHESTTKAKPEPNKAENDYDDENALDNEFSSFGLSSQCVSQIGAPNTAPRLYSPGPEDSSGDEIVFHGRNKPAGQNDSFQREPRKDAESKSVAPPETAAMDEGPTAEIIEREMHEENFIPLRDKRSPIKKGGPKHFLKEEENDILADYIANMDVDHEETSISCDTDPIIKDESDNSKLDPCTLPLDSTGSAGITDLSSHIRAETLPSRNEGLPEGRRPATLEDGEHETKRDVLDMPSLKDNRGSASLSSDDDLKEAELSDSEFQLDEDLSDEDDDLEGIETLHKIALDQSTSNNPKKTGFPSASTFVDALESDPYYGFDIMDFDRPSLKRKTKGNKGPHMILSDSELELELEKAWKNDREKKKSKKQKRQELRSQGLLGRSTDKPDLKSKYADGIGVDDLKSEIRFFLLSSKDSLPLPPMSKQLRKLAHDIANALSLKSHSRGKGSYRFPVLYKTTRTPKFSQQNVSQADKILSQGRFRHRTVKEWDKQAKPRRDRPNASASYMDGDVVGASAPEIGVENKGRAMLEKMGWSSGTALGATNNKGILQPVTHVVKKSKAGLG